MIRSMTSFFANIPEDRISWRDRRLRSAWLVIALAAVVAVIALPRTMINGDEYLYAGEARMLLHGRLLPIDGDPIPGALVASDSEGARYPPGWPALLSIPALFGFRSMFLATLATHLVAGAVLARMLVRRRIAASLVAAYLFHPVFWSFSRTLMSDIPNAAVLLLAMDAWEQNRPTVAGASVAYSFAMRLANIISISGIALATFSKWRSQPRLFASLILGAVLGSGAVLLVNFIKFGHPFNSSYGDAAFKVLNGRMLWPNFCLYTLGLLLIPPFPLACLIVRPREADRWCLMAVPVLLFFFFYSYHDSSRRFLETALGGQRLIIPAHVAMMIGTARIWGEIPIPKLPVVAPIAGVLAALVEYRAVKHLDDRYGAVTALLAGCNPGRIAFNRNASRVALSADARAYYVIDGREPTDLGDVIVVAPSSPTNKPIERAANYRFPPALRERSDTCQKVGEFFIFDLSGRCPRVGQFCDLSNTEPGRATN